MSTALFKTPEYHALMQEQLSSMIDFLFEQNQEFAIACHTKHISFSPELPVDIKSHFGTTVLFVLSGFTYESAYIKEGDLFFEAGFGSENFGSEVCVPLLAINQILVNEMPLIINFAEPLPPKKNQTTAPKRSSMEALLNNPENKKLLGSKKKS